MQEIDVVPVEVNFVANTPFKAVGLIVLILVSVIILLSL